MPMVFSSLLFHMILALLQPHSGQSRVLSILCFILVSVSGEFKDNCWESQKKCRWSMLV